MAISSGQVTIGLTPTLIDGTHNSNFRLMIHNADSTQKVYVGTANVTTSTGLGIEKLETRQFDLNPLEQLYAISSKENHTIHWLKQV